MEQLTEPTPLAFLLQATITTSLLPGSYIAYRWAQAPLKRNRVERALSQLGITQTEDLENKIASCYHLRHYFWPLLLASLIMFVTYSLTHPYVIQRGLWTGFLEEVVDIFGVNNLFPRAIVVGRMLFWGWLGAWIYSMQAIFRRLVAHDLTPNVYLDTGNRFLLAFVVGGIVGMAIGSISTAAGTPFDVNMVTVSIVVFFIGFFPEQGINWITATAKKTLKQQGGIVKETSLAEIEGLSIWHQGRLKQEGIENVQNLATADVPDLVIGTPFTVAQIIDWVDRGILLTHTGKAQLEALEKAGVRRASEVLTNTNNGENLDEIAGATGLNKDELKVLSRGLQSASNIKLVIRFRQQSSMGAA